MQAQKVYRVNTAQWFLTYPRCILSMQEVKSQLVLKGKPIKAGVVAHELHEDGTPHIHVYLSLVSPFYCRDCRFWDLTFGDKVYHGKYEGVRSSAAVQQYCQKEGDFIEWGESSIKAQILSRRDKKSLAGSLLLQGVPVLEILTRFPEYALDAPKLVAASQCIASLQDPVLPQCEGFIPNRFGLLMPLCSEKKRHYWLWSEKPNKGKTMFLKSVQSSFPSFWYNVSEKYQTPHPRAQFVLLDEYSVGHLTVTQLNSMCDGTYQYPVKGGNAFVLNTPVLLVCGNRSPLDIYDSKHHELIQARFVINCLDI